MRIGRAVAAALCAAIGGGACSLLVGNEERRLEGPDASTTDARADVSGADVDSAPIEEPSVDGTPPGAEEGDDAPSVEFAGDGSLDAGEGASLADAMMADVTTDAAEGGLDAAPEAQASSEASAEAGSDGAATPAPGSLDPLFGNGGVAVTTFGGDAVIDAIAIDSAGNILVAGDSSTGGSNARAQATVARYTPVGALDRTFSGNGWVSVAIGSSSSSATGLAVGPAGILIAGPASSNGVDAARPHIGFARLTDAGAMDPTFGVAGTAIVDNAPGYPETPNALALLADGRFIVVAAAQDSNGQYAEVARFSATGGVDTTCNGPYGFELQYIPPAAETPYAMVLTDADSGALVHVGSAANQGAGGAAYAMHSGPGCALDATFDAILDFTPGADSAKAVALSGSAYVLAGVANTGPSSDLLLARLTSSGSLDLGFGQDAGYVTTDVDGGEDDGRAVGVDGRGRIVVAGANASPGGAASQLVVARYASSGSLDPSFGAGGVVVVQPGSPSVANALVIQPDGKIVVGGYATVGKHKAFVLVRLNP